MLGDDGRATPPILETLDAAETAAAGELASGESDEPYYVVIGDRIRFSALAAKGDERKDKDHHSPSTVPLLILS